jgi:hypothetical protein
MISLRLVKKITYYVLVASVVMMAMPMAHFKTQSYARQEYTLRPPSTGQSEQMSQEQAETVVRGLFSKVRGEFGIAEDSAPFSLSKVESIAQLLTRGSITTDEIHSLFSKRAEQEAGLLAHAQPVSEADSAIMREAEQLVNHFLAAYGIRCPDVRVVAVPSELFADEVTAQFLPLHAVIAVPTECEHETMKLTLAIHERLHSAVAGFGPQRLDEGMTRYLTTKVLMGRDGIFDSSRETLLAHYCRSMGYEVKPGAIPLEFFDVEAILAIRDGMGDEAPLIAAYATGDSRELTAVLGAGEWQNIQQLALLHSVFITGPQSRIDRSREVAMSLRYMSGITRVVAGENVMVHMFGAQQTTITRDGDISV